MKQTLENRSDDKKVLREQLALLAEVSKNCGPTDLYLLSIAMIRIANELNRS